MLGGSGKATTMAAKTLRRLVEERRDDVERVARAHGAEGIRLVGSVAGRDEDATSDVDSLVRFAAGRSLFDQVGLIHDLEGLLGLEVDVISEGGLRDSDVAIRGGSCERPPLRRRLR